MRDFVLSADPVVPMLHPRILVELVQERGHGLAAVLRDTGIPQSALSSPEARISLAQYAMLSSNALRLTSDSSLGYEFGQRIHLHNLGMLGLLVMSCSSAREALEAAIEYQAGLSPVYEMSLQVQGPWAVLRCEPTLEVGPYARFALEALLAVLEGNARALLPGDYEIEEVRVPFPRPDHFDRYRPERVRHFRFGCDTAEVRFDAALLDRRIGSGDPITAELARRQCAAQLGPVSRGLLAQIRGRLDASPGTYPSMEEIARELRTSPRSLRRYLRGMATSYQSMVDEARRNHAEQAVRSTTMTIQQVAQLVGYEDVRGFRRAWVRWTGQTPSEYRQALQLRAVAS